MKKPRDTVKLTNFEKESWPEPWEQFDGESDKAYGAFKTYLNLGMGHRTYAAAVEKLGKQRNYEAGLRQWASKYQWRARCQAFDAAQLEKEREKAEQARLEIYATGFTLGIYSFQYVGEDLRRQCEGVQINPETGGEEPYEPHNNLTVDQKIKLMSLGYEMALKNAVEKKSALLEIGTKALKDNAFNDAFDEIIETDPRMHDLYVELMSRALRRANGLDKDDWKKEHA